MRLRCVVVMLLTSLATLGFGGCTSSGSSPNGDAGPPGNDGGTDAGHVADAGPDGSFNGTDCPRAPSVCGNGVVEPGEGCEPPGTATCDASCQRIPQTAPDPACDLTGYWMALKVTVSAATLVAKVQAFTGNHLYYQIAQDGTNFEVVDSLHCGFFVQAYLVGLNGKPTGQPVQSVSLSNQTRAALRCINNSDGRTGTYAPSANMCALDFNIMYTVRGLSPKSYWLNDDWGLGANPTTGQGTPVHADPANPICTCNTTSCQCDDTGRYDSSTSTPGWEDWDQDGEPGITLNPGTSKWFVAMRDWDIYAGTTSQATAGSPLNEFQVPVQWSNEQTLLATTQGAITADQMPDPTAKSCVVFRRFTTPPDHSTMTDAQICQQVIDGFSDLDSNLTMVCQ